MSSDSLDRLIESGLCPSSKASQYTVELRSLVVKTSDEKEVKKSSKLFKALSDSKRLKMLKLLKIRSMCVCEIMVALKLTQPNASHHLNILEDAGLVEKKRQGKWTFFSIANKDLLRLVEKVESGRRPTKG